MTVPTVLVQQSVQGRITSDYLSNYIISPHLFLSFLGIPKFLPIFKEFLKNTNGTYVHEAILGFLQIVTIDRKSLYDIYTTYTRGR